MGFIFLKGQPSPSGSRLPDSIGPAFWIVAGVLGLVWLLIHAAFGVELEQQLSDLRLSQLAPEGRADSVVVVAIDEAALDAIGPWPWPRTRMAEFIARLGTTASPAAIVLDMVFPPGPPAIEDRSLQEVLQRGDLPPVILGQLLAGDEIGRKGRLRISQIAGDTRLAPRHSGHLGNSPGIAAAADGVGHINAVIDADGRLRDMRPILCGGEGCTLALGLAYVSELLGHPPWRLERATGWAGWRLYPEGARAMALPLREDFRMAIPWRPTSPHLYVSAAEVWRGGLPPEMLRDRIVLVGGLAMGLGDRVYAPTGMHAPGVEAHARFIAAMLSGQFTRPPPWPGVWPVLAILLQTGALLLWMKRPARMLIAGVTLAAAWGLGNGLAYSAGWEVTILPPLIYPVMLALAFMLAALVSSRAQLRQGLFAYLPRPLANRLARGEEPDKEVGWSTVLYADIVGYSRVSRGMDPETVAAWGNAGVDAMVEEIEARGGIIDNIAGDGLLAYWREGDPAAQAEQAIAAAKAIHGRLQGLNHDFSAQGLPGLDIGIGIHAGPLVSGSFGGKRRRYTVLGEVANLAHRIERQTRHAGHRLLISAEVACRQRRHATHSVGRYALLGPQSQTELHALDGDAPAPDVLNKEPSRA